MGLAKSFQIFIFFQVNYKSYRQVLTSIENSSLLLKLRIFNKSRLATLYKHSTQRNMVQWTGFILIGETAISMTLNRQAFTKRRWPLKRTCKFHFRLCLSFSICCNSWYGIDITKIYFFQYNFKMREKVSWSFLVSSVFLRFLWIRCFSRKHKHFFPLNLMWLA